MLSSLFSWFGFWYYSCRCHAVVHFHFSAYLLPQPTPSLDICERSMPSTNVDRCSPGVGTIVLSLVSILPCTFGWFDHCLWLAIASPLPWWNSNDPHPWYDVAIHDVYQRKRDKQNYQWSSSPRWGVWRNNHSISYWLLISPTVSRYHPVIPRSVCVGVRSTVCGQSCCCCCCHRLDRVVSTCLVRETNSQS